MGARRCQAAQPPAPAHAQAIAPDHKHAGQDGAAASCPPTPSHAHALRSAELADPLPPVYPPSFASRPLPISSFTNPRPATHEEIVALFEQAYTQGEEEAAAANTA